jgi:hypothetical protein
MIETPADYRSFVFCKANKTPVCSLRSGVRSFVFCKANKTPVCSLRSGVRSFLSFGRDPDIASCLAMTGSGHSLYLLLHCVPQKDAAAVLHANPINPKHNVYIQTFLNFNSIYLSNLFRITYYKSMQTLQLNFLPLQLMRLLRASQ